MLNICVNMLKKKVKTLLETKHVFRKIECFVKIKHVLKIEKRIKHVL